MFTKGETTMASRIRNSRKQVLRKSANNATILNGRADFVMVGNRLIFLQESADGSVSEVRLNLADSTFKQLSKSIDNMLENKNSPVLKKAHPFLTPYTVKWASKRVNKDVYSPVYGINGMGIKDRLKQMEIMRKRKAGLLTA
jgi:hypothetical protein